MLPCFCVDKGYFLPSKASVSGWALTLQTVLITANADVIIFFYFICSWISLWWIVATRTMLPARCLRFPFCATCTPHSSVLPPTLVRPMLTSYLAPASCVYQRPTQTRSVAFVKHRTLAEISLVDKLHFLGKFVRQQMKLYV